MGSRRAGRLKRFFYPGQRWDGTRIFYEMIHASLEPEHVVLNVGAGPATGQERRVLRGRVAKVVGVDPDPVVLENEELDEAHVVTPGERYPFEDGTFDLAYADYVLEHVEDPVPFLWEVRRVLKPGGAFFFRTPNAWHYVSLIARATPHWFHDLVANRVRGLPEEAHEPWPTYHRLNTRRDIERHARDAGFEEIELRFVEAEPSYLKFAAPAFLAGVAYERLVNRFDALEPARANIFGCLR